MSENQRSDPDRADRENPAPPEREAAANANLIDLLLRDPDTLMARLAGPEAARVQARLAAIALTGYFIYGLVVASFARGMQWWASPLKILIGIALSAAICLPSLYITVCLSGAGAQMLQVTGILLSLLALNAVFLAGFAPIAWIFSQSSNLVSFIGALHLLAWSASIFASARMLRVGMQHWNARRTEWGALWILVLLATTLQMETVLRPIVGPADHLFESERQFFLQHWAKTVGDDAKLVD